MMTGILSCKSQCEHLHTGKKKCGVPQILLQTLLDLGYSYVPEGQVKVGFCASQNLVYIWSAVCVIHKAVQLKSKLQHTGTCLVTTGLPHHIITQQYYSATFIALHCHSHGISWHVHLKLCNMKLHEFL
jgi:hypothetical protein